MRATVPNNLHSFYNYFICLFNNLTVNFAADSPCSNGYVTVSKKSLILVFEFTASFIFFLRGLYIRLLRLYHLLPPYISDLVSRWLSLVLVTHKAIYVCHCFFVWQPFNTAFLRYSVCHTYETVKQMSRQRPSPPKRVMSERTTLTLNAVVLVMQAKQEITIIPATCTRFNIKVTPTGNC
jgi:hypothetical protein